MFNFGTDPSSNSCFRVCNNFIPIDGLGVERKYIHFQRKHPSKKTRRLKPFFPCSDLADIEIGYEAGLNQHFVKFWELYDPNVITKYRLQSVFASQGQRHDQLKSSKTTLLSIGSS